MLRYSKNIQVLKFSITLDNSFTAEELKELEKAVAIYKEAPKAIGYKSIVNAFIASAKLSKRWISETNITKMRRLLANAPSRPITILLRRQGLLEGTYTKETSNGRHGYTIYYEIEKILKRFSQLDEIGYMRSISLHKDGKMDWLYATKSEFTKDKAETKKAIRGK